MSNFSSSNGHHANGQASPFRLRACDSTLQLSGRGELVFLLDGQHEWRSEGPMFVLHFYNRQHPRAESLPVPEDIPAHLDPDLSWLSPHARFEVSQSDELTLQLKLSLPAHAIQLKVQLQLRADGQGFTVRTDSDWIEEGSDRLFRVLSLEVLPDFGAARTGEEGYLVLPNWIGCRTHFNKSYPRATRQTIYSSNDQWENNCNLPVWGIARRQGTLCGIVAQGDFDAQLVSRVHWEKDHLNGSHALLVFRPEQQDELVPGPREVRYSFAPPDYEGGEGYVFCGRELRALWQAERGLQTWDEKEHARPEATDYLERFCLKVFMAYKDPQPDGHGAFHISTTFEEARLIAQQCLERGMDKLTLILVGWGQDGHDGMRPTQFPIDERLGGEAQFRLLIGWCRDNDIMLGVHDGYGASYPCSPEFDTDDLIRHRTGEYWESVYWSGGNGHIVCPAVSFEKHVQRDMTHLAELGLHGHHHIDAIGSFMTCFSPAHPLEQRGDYIAQVRQMFEFAIQTFGGVSTEYPFGPYLPFVDGTYHTYEHPSAWHLSSDVGRFFFDGIVPLVPLVLHGSVGNGSAVQEGAANLLELVDLGLVPQSEVAWRAHPTGAFAMPTIEAKIDDIARAYATFYGPQGLVVRVGRASITARFDLAPLVSRTCYSNGVVMMVNRSGEAFDDLPPYSYGIEEAEETLTFVALAVENEEAEASAR